MSENHFYDDHSEAFIARSVSVDMSAIYARFLRYLPKTAHILDAGCGSGRDSLAFLRAGYTVSAFDASLAMTQSTKALTGLTVRRLRFQELEDRNLYDGVWACASLLHVPRQQLPDAFARVHGALKTGGVLFLSFKLGPGDRTDDDGRQFVDLTKESLASLLQESGCAFETLEIWRAQDRRPERSDTTWLNGCLRATAKGRSL